MSDKSFSDFIRPACAYPQLWRILAGSLTIGAVFIGFVLSVMGVIRLMLGATDAAYWFEEMQKATGPTGTLLMLFSFVGAGLGVILAARLFHHRGLASLIGPAGRAARNFVIAAAVVAFFYGLSLLWWSQRYDALLNLDFSLWLSFLPLALVAIVIQSGAEEMAFRGYLLQQLAARFASPLVWLVLPSLLFAALHFDPSKGASPSWQIIGSAALFGLVAGDLTARTGNLGAAWGFHFANNVLAVTLLATKDTITGLALYVTPYTLGQPGLPVSLILADIVTLGLAWITCRRLLSD